MSEQRSTRTENEAVSRVERLLGLLGELTQRDPSPALGERLRALAAQRLREDPGCAGQDVGKGRGMPAWFKPAFAALSSVQRDSRVFWLPTSGRTSL